MSNLNLKLKINADAKGAAAEINKLTDSIGRSGSSLSGFSSDAKKAERQVGSLGHSGLTAGNNLVKGLSPIKAIILGIASALTGISLANLTEDVIRQNRELNNLTTTYKLNRQELQLWQIAMGTMGVSAEKVGDILKDTQDKVGDFLATGGGEAKDIFERLTINAEALRNLQPDKILKIIVKRMDEIKDLSQQERIFLMESIADEASRLLPILSDNAAKLEEIRATANASGAILTDEQNQVLQDASAALAQIDLAASGVRNQIAGIGALFVTEFGDEVLAILQAVSSALQGIDAESLRELAETAKFTAGSLATLYVAVNAAGWIGKIAAAAVLLQTRVIAATGGMLGLRLMIDALTTRAVAGSLAMRGFAGVVGLLGGPVGVAVLAASALAYLYVQIEKEREAINFSKGNHIAYSDAVDKATDAAKRFIGASAAKRAEIKAEMRATIANTQVILQNSRAVLKAAQIRAQLASTKISSNRSRLMGGSNDAREQADNAVFDAEFDVADGVSALQVLQIQLEKLNDTIKVDPIVIPEIKIPTLGGKSSGGKSGSLASQSKQIDTFNSKLQQLEDRLDPTSAKLRNYKDNVALLTDAVEKGIIPKEREAELLQLLTTEYEKTGASVNQVREAEQQYLSQLQDKHAELTLGKRAYQVYTLESKGFSKAVIKEALALADANKAIVAHRAEQEAAAEDLQRLTTEVEDRFNTIFEDALFNGKNLFDSLKQWAKELAQALVMDLLISPITSGITESILGALTGGSGAAGGGVSGLSSLLNIGGKGGLIQRGGALLIGNQIGQGISGIASQFGTNIGNAFAGAAEMTNFQLGGAALIGGLIGGAGQSGTGGSLGGSLGGLGAAALGLGPVGIGLMILGGGALGGLFGGGEVTGSGVRLGYDGGDVKGNNYTSTNKGWLRGSDTDLSDLDSELQARLSEQFDFAEQAIVDAADFFGEDAAQSILDSFVSATHDMDSRDMSEEALQEWFTSVTDGMISSVFGTDLDAYIQDGDTLSETLSRLFTAVQSVNTIVDTLNLQFDLTGLSAADAATALVDLFGSVESLNAASSYYYQNYYSEDEQLSNLVGNLAQSIADIGAAGEVLITSRESLRQFVDGLDLTTEAGQRAFNTAMQLAPALNEWEAALNAQVSALQETLDTQLKALESDYSDRISTYKRFQSLAENLRKTLSDIRFDSNSALSSGDQLVASQSLFDSTLASASTGTDEDAARDIGGIAKQYLTLKQDAAITRYEARQSQADVSHGLAGVANTIETLQDPQEELVRLQNEAIRASAALESSLIRAAQDELEQMYRDALSAENTEIARVETTEITNETLSIISDTLFGLPDLIAEKINAIEIRVNIPGFASGGDFGGGYAIVGEDGPELRQFGASRFTSYQKTKELFGAGNASGDDYLQQKLLLAVERLAAENKQMKDYLKTMAKHIGTSAIVNKFSAKRQLQPLGAAS